MKNVVNKSYQLSYQFSLGNCYPNKIASLEDFDMYLTIFNACSLLNSIQTEAKFICESSHTFDVINSESRYECQMSPEIILQLSDAITYLEQAEPLFFEVENKKENIPITIH